VNSTSGSDILIMMRYFNELVGDDETSNNTCEPEDQGRATLSFSGRAVKVVTGVCTSE